MPITKKKIFLVKLNSFNNIIEKASAKQKEDFIGINLANEFNNLIDDIGKEFSEIKDSLPAKLTTNGLFSDMGKADINYLDFEIFTESLISLLNLVDS